MPLRVCGLLIDQLAYRKLGQDNKSHYQVYAVDNMTEYRL